MTPNSKPKEAPTEKVNVEKAAPVKVASVSVYSAEELAANHKTFKTSREIVEIALRMAGKKTATLEEAKAIIEKFKNKEVK